jgi:hypothetical protein
VLGRGYSSVTEHLPSMYEVLSLIPNTTQTNQPTKQTKPLGLTFLGNTELFLKVSALFHIPTSKCLIGPIFPLFWGGTWGLNSGPCPC